MTKPRALVLLSGGLDSATCLAIAHDMGFEAHALSVAYVIQHLLRQEMLEPADLN